MQRKRTSQTTHNSAQQDLTRALKRLKEGKPRNKRLKALAARNRLKITIANVALEANRSRTLIGTANCPYPEIRQEVLASRAARTNTKSQADTIRDLRAENKDLRHRIAVTATQLATAVGAVWRLKKQLDFQREVNKARASKKVVPFK